MRRKLAYLLVTLILAELAIIVSSRSVLVWQDTVEPGQTYVIKGWGDIGKAKQTSLACYYFTGFDIVGTVFWFSPNNIFGRNRCPFFGG